MRGLRTASLATMDNLVIPKNGTRFSFFSGKEGVGKTTVAASTAHGFDNEEET